MIRKIPRHPWCCLSLWLLCGILPLGVAAFLAFNAPINEDTLWPLVGTLTVLLLHTLLLADDLHTAGQLLIILLVSIIGGSCVALIMRHGANLLMMKQQPWSKLIFWLSFGSILAFIQSLELRFSLVHTSMWIVAQSVGLTLAHSYDPSSSLPPAILQWIWLIDPLMTGCWVGGVYSLITGIILLKIYLERHAIILGSPDQSFQKPSF